MDSLIWTCTKQHLSSKPNAAGKGWLAAAVLIAGLTQSPPTHAVDGCQVLLCFAAPNWRSIPQCIPPIHAVLRDLARGRAFPTCGMGGAGNSASHEWSVPPAFCPPQYTRVIELESSARLECDYSGAVSVTINGSLFSRTWWNMGGDTVTDFSPTAKAQLGTWDVRFDDEYAAWLAALPPPAPPPAPGY
jgi:hypothetical protein